MSAPLPPPPEEPLDPVDGTRIICSRCVTTVGILALAEKDTGAGTTVLWTLADPDGHDLGPRAEFRCRHHGSLGTWKALTLARRARAEQARFWVVPPGVATVRIP